MVAREEPALGRAAPWPTAARALWPGKLADVGVGLSLAGWGVVGLASPELALSPARVALSLLQLLVGAMLVLRGPLQVGATVGQLVAAAPSLLLSGSLVALAPPLESWPLAAEIPFVAGAAGAILSLAWLGRCFAILPGARGVVRGGPFRLVRHPAYACELLMVAGAGIALGHPLGPAAALVVAAFVVARIVAEERPLAELAAYRTYATDVRWRLLPFVW